jgi:hypothetical protein
MTGIRTFGAAAAAVWVIVFVLSGSSRGSLVVEDGPIETATALVFALAIGVGIWAIRTSAAPRIHWLVPGFALVALLDELSFGARIFGWSAPTIAGVEFDSLHDVFDIADRTLGDLGIGRTMTAAILLAVVLSVGAALFASGRLQQIVAWLSAHRPLALVAAAIGMLAVAVVIDQIFSSDLARFVEELLEFGGAIVTVLAAFVIAQPSRVPETV